jgi:CO/xanthine dehydrogenase Mo-binding subunit
MAGRRVALSVTIAAVAAGALAGAVVGVPALSGASSNAEPQAVLQHDRGRGPGSAGLSDAFDAAAQALGMTTEELQRRLDDGTTSISDIAREKSLDVNTVIDAIAAANRPRIEDFVNNPRPTRDFVRGGGRRGHGFGSSETFEAAADALGITPEDLRTALRDGTSIADVARDKGVDVTKVIDDMVAAAQKRIDDARAAGRITEEQANRLKDGLEERMTRFVNGEFQRPERGHGPFGGHRGP